MMTLTQNTIAVLVCSFITLAIVHRSWARDREQLPSLRQDRQCRPWTFINNTIQHCQCYKNPLTADLKCSDYETSINVGICMTTDEDGTFFSVCETYLFYDSQDITLDGVYIRLPNNLSELNHFMCGPMKRKGRVCSDCYEGFSPSVTSIGYVCSNCTGAWYVLPLYLVLEFVPITLFYVATFVFDISVTSSPMSCCVLYSQLIVYIFTRLSKPYLTLETSNASYNSILVLITVYGIWNLDFFRYVVPPFCVSPHLKNIHILFLGYISAFYPLVLIIATWALIQLNSYLGKPLLFSGKLCSYFNAETKKDSENKIIKGFSTFFLLSYTKLFLTSMTTMQFTEVYQTNKSSPVRVLYSDASIRYLSKEHAPFAFFAALVLIVAGVLPALLMALYPIRTFRCLLLKCLKCTVGARSRAALNIFLERFYSCYRDGLDGGRDLRSFAALYLVLRMISFLWFSLPFLTTLYGVTCVLVALVRPYKKTYMNNVDTFMLAVLTFTTFQFNNYTVSIRSTYAEVYLWSMILVAYIPLIVVIFNVPPCNCLWKWMKKRLNCSRFRHCSLRDEEKCMTNPSHVDSSYPYRMLHPEGYESITDK